MLKMSQKIANKISVEPIMPGQENAVANIYNLRSVEMMFKINLMTIVLAINVSRSHEKNKC